ncbi:hypothetical protein SAMN04488068_1242 [Hydrocarboniphaga daqingensis]|uniref:O-antigen ligase-related domain-containing protein n=1 Tax=Hydrocarboniphaga daqingensis TaxID=490188 RepID=A0A1M5M3K4_9GAMM|nr:O-antigen ligase family protein [Hydrocarboniphaga daqingensis]SHG71841.1 hypothetical protein SAMN04488068_1242 [Hydrocarboniphaga daqingensis]
MPISRPITFVVALVGAWMLSGLPLPSQWQTRYDDLRLAQCLLLILLVTAAAANPATLMAPLRSWSGRSLLVVLALGLWSAARSALPHYAAIEVGTLAALAIGALQLRQGTATSPSLARTALLLLCCGPLALGLQFIAAYAAAIAIGDAGSLSSAWDVFVYPRYFAKAATFALPLLWLAAQLMSSSRQGRIGSVACSLAAVAIASQLVASGGRGGVLALLVAALIAAACFGRQGRRFAFEQLAVLASGAALWWLISLADVPSAGGGLLRAGSSGRAALYRDAWTDFVSAPLLGIGPMLYAELGRHPLRSVAGPHSAPLQWLAEWGLPATLLLLAVIAASYRRALRQLRAHAIGGGDASTGIALLAAITAALVHGLLANVANDPLSQTLLMLSIAWFPALPSLTAARLDVPIPGPSLQVTAGWIAGCGLVVGVLAMAVHDGANCVGAGGDTRYFMSADETLYPRYWSQGIVPLEQTCGVAATTPVGQGATRFKIGG